MPVMISIRLTPMILAVLIQAPFRSNRRSRRQGGGHRADTDFFADAADMLAEGDMMMVSAPDGGRILCIAPCETGEVATAWLE
jgi:hypothetical protein